MKRYVFIILLFICCASNYQQIKQQNVGLKWEEQLKAGDITQEEYDWLVKAMEDANNQDFHFELIGE